MTEKLTRRAFLSRTGMVAVTFGAFGSSPFILRAAERASEQRTRNVLVFILLRGGADGLAMCAPYGDAEYYKARPTIALPKPKTSGSESLIDLDGYFGFHPAFAPLMHAWHDGRLALMHAVGSRAMTRSHFDAQEFLETGTPGVRGTTTGWIDRCLAHIPGSELMQGVSFSPLLPRAYLGSEPVLVTEDLAQFEFHAPGWQRQAESLIREMYATGNDGICLAGRQALETLDTIRHSSIGSPPANRARYPITPFGLALRQVGQVIRADLGTRCIFVNFESAFDTHSHQLPSNQEDFANLASSLGALYTDLGKEMDRVVVVVASEFGRTVAEDGSLGTDHGTGGTMLVMGNVRGGRVAGKWPGIAKDNRFEERDLDVTTDFRDVLVEIAKKHLQIPEADTLFPNYTPATLPGLIT